MGPWGIVGASAIYTTTVCTSTVYTYIYVCSFTDLEAMAHISFPWVLSPCWRLHFGKQMKAIFFAALRHSLQQRGQQPHGEGERLSLLWTNEWNKIWRAEEKTFFSHTWLLLSFAVCVMNCVQSIYRVESWYWRLKGYHLYEIFIRMTPIICAHLQAGICIDAANTLAHSRVISPFMWKFHVFIFLFCEGEETKKLKKCLELLESNKNWHIKCIN